MSHFDIGQFSQIQHYREQSEVENKNKYKINSNNMQRDQNWKIIQVKFTTLHC